MTPDQRFSLIIAVLSLLFVVLTAILGLMVKVIVRFTRAEDKIVDMADDMRSLVADKDRAHDAINQRLTWLERRQWGRGPGDGGQPPGPSRH
jgi:hypothetical protein